MGFSDIMNILGCEDFCGYSTYFGGSTLNFRVHLRVFLKVNVQNGNIFGGKYFWGMLEILGETGRC